MKLISKDQVPPSLIDKYVSIKLLTDRFCVHFGLSELKLLARHVVATLCRSSNTELLSLSDIELAASVLLSVGSLNQLFHKNTSPYITKKSVYDFFKIARHTASKYSTQLDQFLQMSNDPDKWKIDNIVTEETSYCRLICGNFDNKSELGSTLAHISEQLSILLSQLNFAFFQEERYISLYGPFIGRTLLELSCTALIGRIDPFRILLLKNAQKQSTYRVGERNVVSIQWYGDVLASKVKDLWSESSLKNPTRALFGDYVEELLIKKMVEKLFDSTPSNSGGGWLDDIRRYGSDGFCDALRGKLQRLYSHLSKGIHHEFIIPQHSFFDKNTVTELVRDVLFCMSSLSLVFTSEPYLPFSISLEQGLSYYENIQMMEIWS